MEIVLTVGIISGISGILAFLLTIANNTINDYGDVKITINESKEYDARGGSSLLGLLIENEVYIPSACGGKGSCGFCKVKVTEGGGPLLPTETGYVTEEEAKDNIRLSCQVKVKNDIDIEIDEAIFNVKQYEYSVVKNESITPSIKHLILRLPEGKEIDFKAGQYIQLLAPKYKGNREEVYRAYSLASSPNQKNEIELLIGFVPEGICTTYVHYHLDDKDKVTVVGPYGDFYYQDNDREMIMVAIGTGMAPILSILRYMRENRITDRKVTFFFGAKDEEELFFDEEFQELEKELPKFRYIPSISRPKPDAKWNGEVGRVTDTITKYIENGENKEAYLCGSPRMIDSVVDLLKEKGLEEEFILYDKFS